MRFEWDRDKAKSNRRKHGVSFDEAVTVFYDPLAATFSDPDHSQEEHRLMSLGYSAQGHLLLVCHTESSGAIRIISARRATPREKKRHENEDQG